MKSIRVGTDCSGIEAPIQALKNLDKKEFERNKIVFSSFDENSKTNPLSTYASTKLAAEK